MGTSRFIPAHAVDRPQLLRLLDVALRRPLTVLVAGAGSGKSVLLSQWADAHPELHVRWIDVGGRDDAATDAIADNLVDAGELIVIVDDIHHLSAATESALARLVDSLPPNVHLVLSSRADLRIVEHRARLRDDVDEIRQAQLAFDAGESAELLRRVTGRELDDASIHALVERTEGWAAGLVLAGVTIRRHPDPAAFIAAFRGSDRLVADYLSEEVLATLDDDARREMLELSALDRFSASLVAAASAFATAPQLLERLQRQSRFLIPLDDHQEWYRFHHLFRDMLRVRLRAERPGDERRVLTAAAEWHLRRGESSEAVGYLLRAQEWERAVEVILAHGSRDVDPGTMTTMLRWISELPESVRRGNVDLLLVHGMLAGLAGREAEAEDLLHTAVDHRSSTPGQLACAHAFSAALAQWRPRPQASIDCAVRALASVGALGEQPTPDLLQLTDPRSLEAIVLVSGGRAHFLAGNLADARDWLERGLASEGSLYSVWRVHALGSCALLEAWEGRTLRATELAAEALDVAEATGTLAHPATADAFLARALVALERGEPGSAQRELREADARTAADQRTQLAWVAFGIGAVLHGTADDAPPPGGPPPLVADHLAALRARTLRLSGSADAARRLLVERSRPSSAVLFELGSAALALGRFDEAREVQRLLAELPDADQPLPRVRALLLSASLSAVAGRTARTDDMLVHALRIADEHHLVSAFVEAGPEFAARISALGVPSLPAVAATIVHSARPGPGAADGGLTEPLTDRERELLVLLPTRFTNTELAERYFVSVNTIKSHMAHIYRKLDVSTRSDAIERATQLGLIGP
jgi:LuxR family maltose regulon positive regulatory protein